MKSWMKITALIAILMAGCSDADPSHGGTNYQSLPEQDRHQLKHALASMQVADGLEVELFASEPMMINPTNMDIDHLGRVWICEARNYRLPHNQLHEARSEGDRILILEDTNGDGQADVSKVFYQGNDINAALGIGVFGSKVIVSASPNVFVLHDDDGDDVADRKEVLFSGISGIDDDHGMHAFTFGPDGRFYFNFGNAGKQLGDAEGNIIKDLHGRSIETNGEHFRQGMTFRCAEDGSDVEVLGHNFRNIYEVAVDAFGNLVQSDNDDDGNQGVRINYIIEGGNYGYKDQVTGAGWRERRVNMHAEIPKRHWHLNDPGVIPNMLQTGSGSPTGITFYEGNLLPEVYWGQPIHAEPGHQVVRAYPMQPDGAGYSAEVKNILKSQDKWFRPSDVCIAPDGSLFVSDWYDAVVGGNGMDDIQKGRVYRIAPNTSQYLLPDFDFNEIPDLLQALVSPNGAARYMGWHGLHSKSDEAIEPLRKMATSEVAGERVRALWLLAAMLEENDPVIRQALDDPSLEVQLAGLRMARYHRSDDVVAYLKSLPIDLNQVEIRREVALSLQHLCNEDAVDLWLQLVQQFDGQDRWELEILGLVTDPCPDLYYDALKEINIPASVLDQLAWRLHSKGSVTRLKELLVSQNLEYAEKQRYLRALHFKPGSARDVVKKLVASHGGEAVRDALLTVSDQELKADRSLQQIILPHLDDIVNEPEWFSTVRTLGLTKYRDHLMNSMLTHDDRAIRQQSAQTLLDLREEKWLTSQLATVSDSAYQDFIGLLGGASSAAVLDFMQSQLNRSNLSIATRKKVVDALGGSWNGQQRLSELSGADQLSEDLQMTAAVRLMNSWNMEWREQGRKLLASLDRSQFGDAPDIIGLSRKEGSAELGESIFQQHCSNCHQVNGLGLKFGPDLSGIGSKLSKRGLYQAIVFPSASINFGYEGVQIKTNNNELYQGYIESETDDRILLRMQTGESREFETNNLSGREEMTTSLMTQGLHKLMSQDELVDLVSYLSGLTSTPL